MPSARRDAGSGRQARRRQHGCRPARRGSGDLDSKTFHERLDRRAIELSFSSTRDTFRGSLRMLKDNRDEAFDLLRMR